MKGRFNGTIRRKSDGLLGCHSNSLLKRMAEGAATVFLLTIILVFAVTLFLFGSYGSNDDRMQTNASTTSSVIKNW